MRIGLVGKPNVGKSTFFSAATQSKVDIANYPFCTIDPNIGMVPLKDNRLDNLAHISKSRKKIYTSIVVILCSIIEHNIKILFYK